MKFDTTPFENGIAIYPQPIALSCGRICRARNSQANYSIYFIQSIPEKNLKYTTISSDHWEHNSELHNQIQERLGGVIIPEEAVLLKNGSSFLKEWQEKKRAIEQSRRAISGKIPWDELKNETVRWQEHLKQLAEEAKTQM